MDAKSFLTAEQKRRYSRNLMLPVIGVEGQLRLKESKVLVVGCGALGSITAMYLAGSGIGKLGLVDFDTVDLSNLQRQLTFSAGEIGKSKAEVLDAKVKALNSDVEVAVYNSLLTKKNASEVIGEYDVIVEGSDNPDTKYLVSDTCCALGKICVLGGVFALGGQVTTYVPGHASYRDIFPEGAAADGYTPCALGGVLGPLPGIVASIQASEVVKLICGFGRPLVDRLLLIDAGSMTFTELTV